MQSLTRNNSVVLVLNSNPDSPFVLAVQSKQKTNFEIYSKIKSPQKSNPGKLSLTVSSIYVYLYYYWKILHNYAFNL